MSQSQISEGDIEMIKLSAFVLQGKPGKPHGFSHQIAVAKTNTEATAEPPLRDGPLIPKNSDDGREVIHMAISCTLAADFAAIPYLKRDPGYWPHVENPFA
jgi:hypothetical protein